MSTDRSQRAMQLQDASPPSSKAETAMRETDADIDDKQLERAITELNLLAHELKEDCAQRNHDDLSPVIGSGHPQSEIMLVKMTPTQTEIKEGVAFYGTAGDALKKAFARLQIDPLSIYGTLLVKCPSDDPIPLPPTYFTHFTKEVAIVSPKIIVAMGYDTVEKLNELKLPLARPIDRKLGVISPLTAGCDVLVTPNIDESLADETAKRLFWNAFRVLGDWYTARTNQ